MGGQEERMLKRMLDLGAATLLLLLLAVPLLLIAPPGDQPDVSGGDTDRVVGVCSGASGLFQEIVGGGRRSG